MLHRSCSFENMQQYASAKPREMDFSFYSSVLANADSCIAHLIQEFTRVSDIWEQLQNSPCACNTVWYSLFHVCTQCAGSELQTMS